MAYYKVRIESGVIGIQRRATRRNCTEHQCGEAVCTKRAVVPCKSPARHR